MALLDSLIGYIETIIQDISNENADDQEIYLKNEGKTVELHPDQENTRQSTKQFNRQVPKCPQCGSKLIAARRGILMLNSCATCGYRWFLDKK
ncbi:MAG: hypothetical protein ACRC3H_19495 [Lachnospiraceae bacterium]